jgi:hypothetical protein
LGSLADPRGECRGKAKDDQSRRRESWLGRDAGCYYGLRQSAVAAILGTVCSRKVLRHGTVRIHLRHAHGAGSSHRGVVRHATKRRQRRACCEQADQHNGEGLDCALHPLSNYMLLVLAISALDHSWTSDSTADCGSGKEPLPMGGYRAGAIALTGSSISSLRMTRLVALREASSNPWPWVMASVGQASTQYPQKMQRL